MDIQPYQFKSVTPEKPLPTVGQITKNIQDNANNVSRAIKSPIIKQYKSVENTVKGTVTSAVNSAKGVQTDVTKAITNQGNSIKTSVENALKGFSTNLKGTISELGKDFTAIIGVLTVVAVLFGIKYLKDILD
jgi:phage-related protein